MNEWSLEWFNFGLSTCPGSPGGTVLKNPPASAGDASDRGLIPGSGRSLEEKRAIHSSILAWKIPWTEEPGRLQSMGSRLSTAHIGFGHLAWSRQYVFWNIICYFSDSRTARFQRLPAAPVKMTWSRCAHWTQRVTHYIPQAETLLTWDMQTPKAEGGGNTQGSFRGSVLCCWSDTMIVCPYWNTAVSLLVKQAQYWSHSLNDYPWAGISYTLWFQGVKIYCKISWENLTVRVHQFTVPCHPLKNKTIK